MHNHSMNRTSISHDLPYATRVIPSGQIYRQLFDAQLQLNQSLSRFDSESRTHRLKQLQSPALPLFMHNGKVHPFNQDICANGFLIDGPEMQALHTNHGEMFHQKLTTQESLQAGCEVRCLPDVIVSKKHNSDILERVRKSKQQRHEAAIEDMHQALSLISSETEPQIEEVTTVLLNRLARSDTEIANIQTNIENEKDLLSFKKSDLFVLWENIKTHTTTRRNWMVEMGASLNQIENVRLDKIRELFVSYGKRFQSIAYLLLPDLERLMDKESQLINQTVLSNHRVYADLYVRLAAADIEKERKQHTAFLKRVEDWKILNIQRIVEEFKEFMQAEIIVQPPGIREIVANLVAKENVINSQRLQVIKTLFDMKPPNSTKMAVDKWSQDVTKLTVELDCVMQVHLCKLHKEYEQVCQQCLEKVDNLKLALIDSGACSSHKATHVVDKFMLPLLGKQQRVYETSVESVQTITEENRLNMDKKISKLFQFAQQAAQLWDMHQISLAGLEEGLQDSLRKSREQHDQIFQEKEADLDIIMDRMRQDANEMSLKDSLVKALDMLVKIKESYEEFHSLQTRIVQTYPSTVQNELKSYENMVLYFFSMSRFLPPDNDGTDESENVEEESQVDVPNSAETDANSAHSTEPHTADSVQSTKLNIKDIIRTSKGTEFYVLHEDLDFFENEMEEVKPDSVFEETFLANPKDHEEIFLTEVKHSNKTIISAVKDSVISFKNEAINVQDISHAINIPASLFLEMKNSIRLQFLEHLDDWFEQALLRANSIVAARYEELNSELDLKLHLHQPRSRRAELDIHNVRAAELTLHAERMARQFSGIEKALSELVSRFKAMGEEHRKLGKKFKEDIEAKEEVLSSATKPAKLVSLSKQVAGEMEKFMSVVRTSLRQFRHHLDETLQTLRESNARFICSFQLFSEGGNFCPEEVTLYRKKLEKISSMIDNTEGSIMSDLEGMEIKHLENSSKSVGELEDKLRNHMNDLSFLEAIAHLLSSAQVKIKVEVAKCNIEAQELDQKLNNLQHKMAALNTTHVGAEEMAAALLNTTLPNIFESFVRRSQYLHCGKTISTVVSIVAGSVKPADEPSPEKEGKSGYPQERMFGIEEQGPATSLIKSIFRCVELSKRKGVSAQTSPATGKGLELNTEPSGDNSGIKKKSLLPSTGLTDSGKTFPKSVDVPKATQSGKSLVGQVSKPAKLDKKNLLPGDQEGSSGDKHNELYFIASIQNILKEALDELLTGAELFYSQKGSRPVTRPLAIPETYEQCAEIMLQKNQSYFAQSDEYQNKCLQDFHAQIEKLQQLSIRIPNLVITNLLNRDIQQSTDSQNELFTRFSRNLANFTENQKSIQKKLRTTLGHPQNAENLAALCAQEHEAHNEYLKAVTQHIQERTDCALEHARSFLDRLVKSTEKQLILYDSMLTEDDVGKAQLGPVEYPLCKLLRGPKVEKPLQDDDGKDFVSNHRASWVGVPSNQFVAGDQPGTLEVTPTVETTKGTVAHFATVKARDEAYESYKEYFEKSLHQIEATRKKLISSEANWNKSWETSVKKVTSLYQQGQ